MDTVFHEYETHYERKETRDFPETNGKTISLEVKFQISTEVTARWDEESGVLVMDFRTYASGSVPLRSWYPIVTPQLPSDYERHLETVRDQAQMVRTVVKKADAFYLRVKRLTVSIGPELHFVESK